MGPAPTGPEKEEKPEDLLDDEDDWEPEVDPWAEKVQLLVVQTRDFIIQKEAAGKGPTDWFRKHIATLGRGFGFHGWDAELKRDWTKEFTTIMRDPTFLQKIAEKVLRMEMGHAAGPNKVAKLAATAAGFTAFTVAGV
jgi:hypothetical protein